MNKNGKQSGFTLIELSIVIIISGLMIVAALSAYRVYSEKRKIDQINTQMADLDQYIKNFPTMIDPATVDPLTGIGTPYGRFPCPAPMDGTGAGNDFDSEDCSIAPIAGVRPNGTNGGAPVLVGKIPAATLGISSDYMSDPYGNYLVYAVTQGASNSVTYGTISGSIQVIEEGIDRNPASVTRGQIIELERHNNVQYMVVSMGDTDAGAYAFNGTQTFACPNNDVKEHENCDGDARFITSLLHEGNVNDFYDDKLLFAANTVVVPSNEETPSCEQREVFQTTADDCPEGWEEDSSLSGAVVENGGGSGSYYNIDPDTGDYYFTQFETSNTVHQPRENNNFLGGMSFLNPRSCVKSEGNGSKTRCSTKKVKINVASHQSVPHMQQGQITANDPFFNKIKENKCPEGYKLVDAVRGDQHCGYGCGSEDRGNHIPFVRIQQICSQ